MDSGAPRRSGPVEGEDVAIDGTTLEANAAMRSIVRRDTGETYRGVSDASREGVWDQDTDSRRHLHDWIVGGRRRARTQEWTSPADPDATDHEDEGRPDALGHKAEHAVDLDTGAIVALTVQDASVGDTGTIMDTLAEAEGQLVKLQRKAALEALVKGMQGVVADKGYHSDDVLVGLERVGLRSYISEPDRGRRRWRGDELSQRAVYANRRRARGERGQRLQRTRGERVERSFAHMYETGGMRRTHLRGHTNILKRLLIHAGGFNLGRLLRHLFGIGTPRGLQGRSGRVLRLLLSLYRALRPVLLAHEHERTHAAPRSARLTMPSPVTSERPFTTGC